MRWNNFTGLMARRLLVNWRVPVEVAGRVLPGGVRPTVVGGWGVAGLCMVRLERLRPMGLPAMLGVASENLAVRMGVEWDVLGGVKKGVLIFRRETGSWVNARMAERVGFGVHHRATFRVMDDRRETHVTVVGKDDGHFVNVSTVATERIMRGSVFRDLEQAGHFFRGGECGYSPGRVAGMWAGARLQLQRWELRPMRVLAARSTYLEKLFGGAAILDSAFVMRDIEHTWSACGEERFGVVGGGAEERMRAA